MKTKILSVLVLVLFSQTSFAGGPEIWWAINADCNVFMKHLGIWLKEKNGNAEAKSYQGHGIYNYESMTFDKCTNDDDSITCEGTGDGLKPGEKHHFTINRRTDGTFVGKFIHGRGQEFTLGCVLSR